MVDQEEQVAAAMTAEGLLLESSDNLSQNTEYEFGIYAANVEAKSAVIKAIPSGLSIRPSIPVRKKSGMKLTTMMKVELRIGRRTSREALKTTWKMDWRSDSGSFRFWRRCLNTFSTSTMASSTSEPMAIAIPPILIVLIVNPINFNVNIDTSSDNGIVTSEISVVRTFIRKKNSTIMTNRAPS